MELTKRSNFKLDITHVGNQDVAIKKGLKAIDFIAAIGVAVDDRYSITTFYTVTSAADLPNGTVEFSINSADYIYDPSTGQITVANI